MNLFKAPEISTIVTVVVVVIVAILLYHLVLGKGK